MRKRYTPLFFLVLSIAVAGCTALGGGGETQNQVTFTQNDGLTVAFSSATGEYFSDGDADATFTADIQNTGEGSATLRSLRIFGASWATDDGSDSRRTGLSLSLDPVEQENNLPGGRTSYIFNPEINVDIPQGQSDTYTVGLETLYDYVSQTRSSLTIMSRDRFRDSRADRQQMRNDIGGAPVQVRFRGMTPFPARGDTITIPVDVSNVGNGQVTDAGVELTVRTEGGETLGNCNSVSGRLFEGSRTFSCQYDIEDIDVPERTATLIATARYRYVEEATTTVTVVGEGEFADTGSGAGDDSSEDEEGSTTEFDWIELEVDEQSDGRVFAKLAFNLPSDESIDDEEVDKADFKVTKPSEWSVDTSDDGVLTVGSENLNVELQKGGSISSPAEVGIRITGDITDTGSNLITGETCVDEYDDGDVSQC